MVDAESVATRLERLSQLLEQNLEPDLAERLAEAVGMRNILVHGYLEVDDEAVWDALERLDDLRAFAAFAQSQIS